MVTCCKLNSSLTFKKYRICSKDIGALATDNRMIKMETAVLIIVKKEVNKFRLPSKFFKDLYIYLKIR